MWTNKSTSLCVQTGLKNSESSILKITQESLILGFYKIYIMVHAEVGKETEGDGPSGKESQIRWEIRSMLGSSIYHKRKSKYLLMSHGIQ